MTNESPSSKPALHPEAHCERCGGPNVVWFAPNELWNRVVGSTNGVLCPVCFVRLATDAGIDAVWRVAPDEPGALRHIAERIRDHACSYGAPADSVLVKRELIGQLAQALGGSISEPPSDARYEWLKRNISGEEWRRIGIVYGSTAEIDQLIDEAMSALTKPAHPPITFPDDMPMSERIGDPRIDGRPDETSAAEPVRCKATAYVQGETKRCEFGSEHDGEHIVQRRGTTPFRWRT